MYMDSQTLVSGSIQPTNALNPQTVTGAAPVLSANAIDQLVQRDLGQGSPVAMHVQVITAFAGLTALEMQIVSADDAALSSNVNVQGSSGAIPVAQLVQGAKFPVEMNPRPQVKGQRYLGARFVPTGTGTAGALIAWLGTAETADPTKVPMMGSGFGVA